MREIPRYYPIDDGDSMVQSAAGQWVRWSDVEKLQAQLPEGMKHCTFQFVECEKGHGRLTATNWIDHGCQTCELEKVASRLQDMTAKAVAAIWLVEEDINHAELHGLHAQARAVLLGEDKKTIAKLQDKVANLQQAVIDASRPKPCGVTAVYGYKGTNRATRWLLPLLQVNSNSSGGLEIEAQLP